MSEALSKVAQERGVIGALEYLEAEILKLTSPVDPPVTLSDPFRKRDEDEEVNRG